MIHTLYVMEGFLRQARLSFAMRSQAVIQNVFEQAHLACEGQQAIIIQVLQTFLQTETKTARHTLHVRFL